MDPYLAQIVMFGGNFAPLYWHFCDGKLLSIADNTALFSLIGTMYGGDGQVTFALPDFRGRIPLGTGQGGGLSYVDLGETSGSEKVTLTLQNLPQHGHQMIAYMDSANSPSPNGQLLATNPDADFVAPTSGTVTTPMSVAAIGATGGNQPINNMQAYLAVNYVICVEGIYPSRN
ncbi:MAG: tail fiber protein [Haliscomenobacter sp.]|uniref:phage tail protein n=1 Tax=Haliscomenobacter sp. TaxID=2717303 RepID=UPI0029B64C0C|nr:tail fiber protein [Haliscomenobacter sp.]MDX2067070.1 tail fiber protein [Haliscomenobacter sp.]